jgi:hypothetical protein
LSLKQHFIILFIVPDLDNHGPKLLFRDPTLWGRLLQQQPERWPRRVSLIAYATTPKSFLIPRRAVYIFKINHSNTSPFSVASHGHDYYGVCPAIQFDPAAAGYQRRVNKGAVDNPPHALTPYSHKNCPRLFAHSN